MRNLQKRIMYGIFLAAGMVGIFAGIIFGRTEEAKAGPKVEIQGFAPIFYIPAVAVETGSQSEQIEEKLRTVTVKAFCSDDSVRNLSIRWDLTSINLNRPGVYPVRGCPSVSEELSLSEEISLPVYTTTISVQDPGQPEIQSYSCMQSAGIFFFPWISGLDTEHISVWLRKSGGDWIDLTQDGYAICMDDGLYLGNTAMAVGNTYELAVSGKGFQDRILQFTYASGDTLEIRNYRRGSILGSGVEEDKTIRSVEETDPRMNDRCMAFALEAESNLEPIRETLEKSIILMGSTAGTYEDTAENPARAMHAKWDLSAVNSRKPGVYKVTGRFLAPEGYDLAEDLELPEMTVYISIQDPETPEIDTYYMPEIHQILFPMVLSNIRSRSPEVWLKENDSSWEKITERQGELKENGICLYRNSLKQGSSYKLCLTWEGGGTGIFSFAFGEDFITNENWIGRDFADRDGQEFPDISVETTITPEIEKTSEDKPETDALTHPSEIVQTPEEQTVSEAPGAPEETNVLPSPETVTEAVTDKWTIISGRRLDLILKYMGNEVNFEKDGISLKIPGSVARSWKVKEDQTVQSLVQKTSDQSYEVKLYKGDQEITDTTGSQVVLPVKEIFPDIVPETIEVTDSDGEKAESAFDEDQKLLTVRTDKTGTFHVEGRKTEIKEKPYAVAAMVAAAALAVGIRTGSGKRGDRDKKEG